MLCFQRRFSIFTFVDVRKVSLMKTDAECWYRSFVSSEFVDKRVESNTIAASIDVDFPRLFLLLIRKIIFVTGVCKF
jgi:hypothetical protein